MRLAIARNTNTPRANLKLLSSDTDHRVAAQARDTLRDQQRRKQGQDDRILQPLPAIDLSPVISELTRRLGATKDRCSGYPSLLMPWHLVGTLWWGILPFGVRLGTTSFDNPFHVRVPALSEQLLERLSRHADPEVRCLAARNLGAPVALLHELAGDSSAEVRYSVGMNPSTPDALQVELAKAMAKSGIPCPHEMPHGEGNPIEQDPGIAPGFLRTLARRSGGYAGCKWVALNPSLPEESLLSPSFTRDQKGLVARNPSLPQKLILKWAMDPESREDVAINPSLPQALRHMGGAM